MEKIYELMFQFKKSRERGSSKVGPGIGIYWEFRIGKVGK
jgi:hypothetical protein